MIILKKTIPILLLIFSLISCRNSENVIYFQGEFSSLNQRNHTSFIPTLEKNDLLDIKLISQNAEASALFTPKIDNGRSSVTYASGVPAKGGFLVNQKGEIELPYIGTLLVAGLTRDAVVAEIENRLSEYINEPIIQLQILNFKISILGDVRNPGTFNIPNEKISIVEAIGIAGDLNITGMRKDIKLIREIGDGRKEYNIDLTDKNIFNSEIFFLKQNDIIYVPQNRAKISNSNFSQIYLPILSSISIILSSINIFQQQ